MSGGHPCEFLDEGARLFDQRYCLGIQIDVDEPCELLDPHTVEADVGDVEVDEVLGERCPHQLAGQAVGPGVVRAHDAPCGACTLEELMGTVAAHVVEGVQFAIGGTRDGDRVARHLGRHVGAGLAELLDVADPLP